MKMQLERTNTGSTILCALCTILIISLIGANVLLNCTTRYNVSSKQVKGWKEALYTAEGGADIAFSVVRKCVGVSDPSSTVFISANGWTTNAGPSYSNGPYKFGQNNSLSAQVTVDQLTFQAPGLPEYGNRYYRIRSQGTATLFGLPRVGMDDRMDKVTRGDSLLRKIDFKYDHFKAKYGDGDGNAVPNPPLTQPQVMRRIETIAVPQFLTFPAALQATGSFGGPGPAGLIDSYDSRNGPYTFVATNSSAAHYSDSRNGNVSAGTSVFTEYGPIYGNVTTNGGTITNKSNGTISGTIDNNVPFTVPPLANPWSPTDPGWDSTSPTTITLPSSATSNLAPAQYVYSSLTSAITINPYVDPLTNEAQETYVKIVVNGDVKGNITINNHVNAQIYFTGNLSIKMSQVANNNVDGVAPNYSRAGHLQFFGISPTPPATQTVSINPPGSLYATIYAPNADVTVIGNPDIYGAIVCHNYSGNGNTGFHYDKQIAQLLLAVTDYRIASYIEDVR